jgi:hypothetical protein
LFIALEAFNGIVTLYGDVTHPHPTADPPPADGSEDVTIYGQWPGTVQLFNEIFFPGNVSFRVGSSFMHFRLTLLNRPGIGPGAGGGGYGIAPSQGGYEFHKNIRKGMRELTNLTLSD